METRKFFAQFVVNGKAVGGSWIEGATGPMDAAKKFAAEHGHGAVKLWDNHRPKCCEYAASNGGFVWVLWD